ncbi:MAG TPA: cupin domain-containing protein, partial [Rhodothermales bacterium]|nr:cupin domain-containing protein [Rhodothermales bacterium]
MTADDLKALLNLQPLPEEGGFYAETYRAAFSLAPDTLPSAFAAERSLATAIYYLLTPDTFSALHRLPGDEIYHFYLGDPVELLQLHPNSKGEVITLGQDLQQGMRLQHVVPGGVWQGSRLAEGGAWA